MPTLIEKEREFSINSNKVVTQGSSGEPGGGEPEEKGHRHDRRETPFWTHLAQSFHQSIWEKEIGKWQNYLLILVLACQIFTR